MEINRTGRALNHRDRKNPKAHELWMTEKRQNRPYQVFVIDEHHDGSVVGHYVKVATK